MGRKLAEPQPFLQPFDAPCGLALAQAGVEGMRFPDLLGKPPKRGGLCAGHRLPLPTTQLTRFMKVVDGSELSSC